MGFRVGVSRSWEDSTDIFGFCSRVLCMSVEGRNPNKLDQRFYVHACSQSVSESFHTFNDRHSLSLLPVLDDHVS